ncbi:hypothetical protein AGR7C_Cc160189 [Agrobacterium deltaense Zutra 3/1]|uniref:Uncharacterized protein n=2 Tax=Agrobacterium deltaense TaxID=1183412 RepID=A0A1S7PMR0_9HYPH|nr:hypothetical protein AGR7C_Cc160189 [Agrobacterium deltaense Zutra 3/1]CUX30293.1 hypothetical protein AGR7B_Cc50171 [Agrobacterium deltaense RV3]CVI55610.1 hypothetical protein AGR7A_Cc210142 [Agrobacterium deltaense NCPPB 1641]
MGDCRPALLATACRKRPHHGVLRGFAPRMFLRLLLFLDSCSPVYFSAWFSMPAEADATTVKDKATDRINADTLKRLALMLEGARVL